MIRNNEELQVVRKQLHRIEKALDSLRQDVLPKNRRNFEILSEGYVDQIQELKKEIDAYSGIMPEPSPGGISGTEAEQSPSRTN